MLLYFVLLTNYDNSIHRKLSIVWIEKCSNNFFGRGRLTRHGSLSYWGSWMGVFFFKTDFFIKCLSSEPFNRLVTKRNTFVKNCSVSWPTYQKAYITGFLKYLVKKWLDSDSRFSPWEKEPHKNGKYWKKNSRIVRKLRYQRNNLGVCIGFNHNKGAGAKIFI